MVGSVYSTMKRCGEYGANFLLGTGSEVMGKKIGQAIKTRSKTGMSLPKAIGTGFKVGFNKTNAQMTASGGFFKNLANTFKAVPGQMATGWKNGTGFFSKIAKSIKPLGKLMPFAMNALWFAGSIPDIVGRTKEEGIWGGIKETGKALTNMAVISLAASVGSSFGFLGMLALPMAANMVTKMLIGKTWGEKKADAEEAKKLAEEQAKQNIFGQQTLGQKLDITSKVA